MLLSKTALPLLIAAFCSIGASAHCEEGRDTAALMAREQAINCAALVSLGEAQELGTPGLASVIQVMNNRAPNIEGVCGVAWKPGQFSATSWLVSYRDDPLARYSVEEFAQARYVAYCVLTKGNACEYLPFSLPAAYTAYDNICTTTIEKDVERVNARIDRFHLGGIKPLYVNGSPCALVFFKTMLPGSKLTHVDRALVFKKLRAKRIRTVQVAAVS